MGVPAAVAPVAPSDACVTQLPWLATFWRMARRFCAAAMGHVNSPKHVGRNCVRRPNRWDAPREEQGSAGTRLSAIPSALSLWIARAALRAVLRVADYLTNSRGASVIRR